TLFPYTTLFRSAFRAELSALRRVHRGRQRDAESEPGPFDGYPDRVGGIAFADPEDQDVRGLCRLEPGSARRRNEAQGLADASRVARAGLRQPPGTSLAGNPAAEGLAI